MNPHESKLANPGQPLPRGGGSPSGSGRPRLLSQLRSAHLSALQVDARKVRIAALRTLLEDLLRAHENEAVSCAGAPAPACSLKPQPLRVMTPLAGVVPPGRLTERPLSDFENPAWTDYPLRLDERTPGSGLGLAIVRDLVERRGGRLTLGRSPLGGLRAEVEI